MSKSIQKREHFLNVREASFMGVGGTLNNHDLQSTNDK